jgi:hypothetical protein
VRVALALKAEEEYFAKHAIYSSLPNNVLGTKALIEKLTTILFRHIKAFLPKIMDEIDGKIRNAEEK